MRHKIPLDSWRTYIFIYKNQIWTPFQDQSGMDISNLLSCHKSSIVPLRLDTLLEGLGLLPSFDDLTFLDKIVLHDTRWRDVLGKMYVMWMYAYVSSTVMMYKSQLQWWNPRRCKTILGGQGAGQSVPRSPVRFRQKLPKYKIENSNLHLNT